MPFRTARYSRFFLWPLLGSLLLLTLGLTACKRKSAAGEGSDAASGDTTQKPLIKIGILVDDYSTTLRYYQVAWLEKFVRSRTGVELVMLDAGGSADLQVKQIEAAAKAEARAIFVFPVKSDAVTSAMRTARWAGVFVLAFAKDLPDDAVSSAVYTDEKMIGRLAAEHAIAALTKKAADDGFSAVLGRVVQIRGDDSKSSPSSEMALGFMEALQKAPGLTLVHDAPAYWNSNDAIERMREAIRLQKRFDVVFAHDDVMAVGVDKAAIEANARENLLIMGVGGSFGSEGGLKKVQDGIIDATVFYPPLVDVAWKQVRQLLKDPAYKAPRHSLVKPFTIDYSVAMEIARNGLPKPDVE